MIEIRTEVIESEVDRRERRSERRGPRAVHEIHAPVVHSQPTYAYPRQRRSRFVAARCRRRLGGRQLCKIDRSVTTDDEVHVRRIELHFLEHDGALPDRGKLGVDDQAREARDGLARLLRQRGVANSQAERERVERTSPSASLRPNSSRRTAEPGCAAGGAPRGTRRGHRRRAAPPRCPAQPDAARESRAAHEAWRGRLANCRTSHRRDAAGVGHHTPGMLQLRVSPIMPLQWSQPAGACMPSRLFEPIAIGDVQLPNRLVVAPMCQYSASDGSATDWHLQHLSQLAYSGAGLVVVEATAVERRGRITHTCLGCTVTTTRLRSNERCTLPDGSVDRRDSGSSLRMRDARRRRTGRGMAAHRWDRAKIHGKQCRRVPRRSAKAGTFRTR